MSKLGSNNSIINTMGARKKMSDMNGDFLLMLRHLKRTEVGPTMCYNNKFHREICDRQVVMWQKEKNMTVRNIRKTQEVVKQHYYKIQSDKKRIVQDKNGEGKTEEGKKNDRKSKTEDVNSADNVLSKWIKLSSKYDKKEVEDDQDRDLQTKTKSTNMERVEKTQGQEQKKTFEELWGHGQFINIKCLQKTQEVLERNLRKIQLDKIRTTRYKRIEETSKNIRRHRTAQYTKAVFKEILQKIKLRESKINNELNLDEKCNRESSKVKKLINRETQATIASDINIENSYRRFICVDDGTTKDIIPPLVRTRRKIQYPSTYPVMNNTLSTSSLDNTFTSKYTKSSVRMNKTPAQSIPTDSVMNNTLSTSSLDSTISSKYTKSSVKIDKTPAKSIPTDSVMNNTLSTSSLDNTVSSKYTKSGVKIDKTPAQSIPTDSVMNNTLSTSSLDDTVASKYTKNSVKIDKTPAKSIRSIVITIPDINTDASQGQRSSLVESPTEGSSTMSEHSDRLENYHVEKDNAISTRNKSTELPPIRVTVKGINRLPVSYFAEKDNSISVCPQGVPSKMVSTRNSSIDNNNMVNFRITHETPSMVVSPRNSSVSIPLVRKEMGKYNNRLSITGKNPQLTTDQHSQLSLDENP